MIDNRLEVQPVGRDLPFIESSGAAKTAKKQRNFRHEVELDIGGFRDPPFPILGRGGFFDHVEQVIFDGRKMRVELLVRGVEPTGRKGKANRKAR